MKTKKHTAFVMFVYFCDLKYIKYNQIKKTQNICCRAFKMCF